MRGRSFSRARRPFRDLPRLLHRGIEAFFILLCSWPLAGGEPRGTSETIRGLIEEGSRAFEARKYPEAVKCFERALAMDPESKAAREGLLRSHTGLGVEASNSGEPGKAREAFERALRYGEDGTARFGLGYIDFLDLKDVSAKEDLRRSLELEPGDSRAYKLLAIIEYRRGENSEALRLIDRALELDPKDEEAQAFRNRWSVEGKLSGRLKEYKTRHFLVRADGGIHPESVREILGTLEGIHDSIGQILGHWPARQIPVLLFLEEDFYKATGSFHWVGGVYDGQIKVPVRAEECRPGSERPILLRTLRHEFTHVVVKELCPGCPNWLSEGIAQHFELQDPLAGTASRTKGEGEERRRRTEKSLRGLGSRRVPLEKIPPRLWEIKDADFARLTYLEGLGFVDHLVEKFRAFRLRLLLSTFRREGSLSKAFQATYGMSLGELEKEWWKSLEG